MALADVVHEAQEPCSVAYCRGQNSNLLTHRMNFLILTMLVIVNKHGVQSYFRRVHLEVMNTQFDLAVFDGFCLSSEKLWVSVLNFLWALKVDNIDVVEKLLDQLSRIGAQTQNKFVIC